MFLDANENSLASLAKDGFNRYPDPLQRELKKEISKIKGVHAHHIFLGNGSDEPIDLLFRAFCEPHIDKYIQFAPTYGMYKVCADINGNEGINIPLNADFDIEYKTVAPYLTDDVKLVFICSPNNPTGNTINVEEIEKILNNAKGIVVIDEAYIDFSSHPSYLKQLGKYDNLVVLQTFSKAWGMAALRLGMAFASEQIITVLNSIKYPYNLNQATQDIALEAVKREGEMKDMVKVLNLQKTELTKSLQELPQVSHIYPSDANFVLCKVSDANDIYRYLAENLIIVRNRSKVMLCENCLRITVGTQEENKKLIECLKKY